jgi:hypothetical protein
MNNFCKTAVFIVPGHCGDGEKPHKWNPCNFPSGCYSLPSLIVITIALHVYRHYDSSKHMFYIANNQNSDYAGLGQREVDRNIT